MFALRLPPNLEKRLDDLAKATGRSKSFYARMAIIEYVGDLEDIYLAAKRLEDHRACRADSISLEDMMNQHGLAN